MLLPFLPYILAFFGLIASQAIRDSGQELMAAWQVWATYAAPILIGYLIGRMPDRGMGSRSPMRLSSRRMILLGIWLILLATVPLHHSLVRLLDGFPRAEEITILLLLANFWLADGLTIRAPDPMGGKKWRAETKALWETMRIPLPMLILFGLNVFFTPMLDQIFLGSPDETASSVSIRIAGMLALYGIVFAVIVPMLIKYCWGLRRLSSTVTENVVLDELAANGIRWPRVYQWPEEVMGATTAAVIGLIPPFRFMLIGEGLAKSLSEAEVRAVTAHEAAHIRHHHLWYFFAAILAFVLLMQSGMDSLVVVAFWFDAMPPIWTSGLIVIAALLLFLRYVIGFLSRQFERQADGNAFQRHGLEPLRSSLMKIAQANGIQPQAKNWHHYGILGRISYLYAAGQKPELLQAHDRRVKRVKAGILAVFVSLLIAQPLLAQVSWLGFFAENFLPERLEQIVEPSPAELAGVRYLASEAYGRGDYFEAERYFRLAFRWQPEDPQTQNNLAWLLVTASHSGPGLLQEGLLLAERASTARQAAYIWDTLAEAYFRANQLDKAEAAASRALLLAEADQERGGATLEYYRHRWRALARSQKES